jgi:hypothetical protein
MTADRDSEDCYHEAGHSVALWRLTGTVPPAVSIAPAVCLGRQLPDFTGHDSAAPLCLAEPGLRRAVEVEVLVCLAGLAAGDMAAPLTGRLPDPPEVVALARTALSPEIRARLDAIEAEPAGPVILDPRSDGAAAEDLLQNLVGLRWTNYLPWCRSEAHALVHANAELIERLAGELLQRRYMSGAALAAFLGEVADAEPSA